MYSGTWKKLSVVFGNKNVRILNRIYQLQDITCWRLFDNKNQWMLQERMIALSREKTKHPTPRHIPTCVWLWTNFPPFYFLPLTAVHLLAHLTTEWSDACQNCVPGWNSHEPFVNHADRLLNLKICSFKWTCQVAESSRADLKSGREPGSELTSLDMQSLHSPGTQVRIQTPCPKMELVLQKGNQCLCSKPHLSPFCLILGSVFRSATITYPSIWATGKPWKDSNITRQRNILSLKWLMTACKDNLDTRYVCLASHQLLFSIDVATMYTRKNQ